MLHAHAGQPLAESGSATYLSWAHGSSLLLQVYCVPITTSSCPLPVRAVSREREPADKPGRLMTFREFMLQQPDDLR